MKHNFGSDNHSGVDTRVLNAIKRVNEGYCPAYGIDEFSETTLKSIEQLFGGDCKAFFVLNGTGANILSLSVMCNSYDAVICPTTAHINVDECGAPEKIMGSKLIPISHTNGKVSPEEVKKYLHNFGDQHHSQPKVLSISQPTELGTLYTKQEIKELADLMHSFDCYLYMDGSRISNAVAALGISLEEMTKEVGVDAVSFGGTKNGLLMGETVVFFDSVKHRVAPFFRKQMTQLYSKSRFIAAQFDEYIKNDLYIELASHSNKMAKYLESLLDKIPQIEKTQKVETNAVFAKLPKEVYEAISKEYFFHVWDQNTLEVRWMTSFQTTENEITEFITQLLKIYGNNGE